MSDKVKHYYLITQTLRVEANSLEEAAEKVFRYERDDVFYRMCKMKEKDPKRFGRPEVSVVDGEVEEFDLVEGGDDEDS